MPQFAGPSIDIADLGVVGGPLPLRPSPDGMSGEPTPYVARRGGDGKLRSSPGCRRVGCGNPDSALGRHLIAGGEHQRQTARDKGRKHDNLLQIQLPLRQAASLATFGLNISIGLYLCHDKSAANCNEPVTGG